MSIESLNSGEQSQPENDPQMEALVGRMKQVMEDTSVKGTPQERLLAQAEQSIDSHFSDDKGAFTDYIAWLEEAKDVPDDELALEAAQRWRETVIGEFGKEDVEARERAAMGDRHISLNDSNTISYTLEGETVDLHVQSARTLSTVEKVRAIKGALEELATQLKTKKELSDIEEITATSWIVAKSPQLMEKLGFTIDGPIEKDERPQGSGSADQDVWRAHISVEDFLEQYTEKSDKKEQSHE